MANSESALNGKTIILGISGGIAAYKCCELTRMLVKKGADVHTILTKAALNFVTPLTLQTLSGNPVHQEMFSLIEEKDIGVADQPFSHGHLLLIPTAKRLGRLFNARATR